MNRFLIIFLTIPTILFSQNKQAIRCVDEYMGMKVGLGVCVELPEVIYGKTELSNDFRIGIKHIQVGDIITFDDAVDKFGDTIKSHIAIVYAVKNKNTIIIADQNHTEGDDTLTKKVMYHGKFISVYVNSKVRLWEMNLNDYSGKEYFNNHVCFWRFKNKN